MCRYVHQRKTSEPLELLSHDVVVGIEHVAPLVIPKIGYPTGGRDARTVNMRCVADRGVRQPGSKVLFGSVWR